MSVPSRLQTTDLQLSCSTVLRAALKAVVTESRLLKSITVKTISLISVLLETLGRLIQVPIGHELGSDVISLNSDSTFGSEKYVIVLVTINKKVSV